MNPPSSRDDRIQMMTLNVASFLANLSITMMGLGLVYYFRSVFALGPGQIGLSTQVTTLVYFLGCMFLSPIVQNVKPRHSVTIATLSMALSMTLFLLTKSFLVACLCLALYGGARSLFWPAIEAWFSRGKEGKALNRASNAFNFSWSFGTGLSTLLSGFLVDISLTLPFIVGIAILLCITLLVSLVSTLVPGMRSLPSEKANIREGNLVDHSTPLRYSAWCGVFLVYLGRGVLQNIFPLYGADYLGTSASVTGALLFVRGLSTCLTFVFLARTSFWQMSKRTIFSTQLLFALLCVLCLFLRSWWFYALFFFLFGIVFAFGYSLSMFHGVSGCVNRAKRMAFHEILLTLGIVAGSGIGGFLYERISFSLIMFLYGCVALLFLGVEAIFMRKISH